MIQVRLTGCSKLHVVVNVFNNACPYLSPVCGVPLLLPNIDSWMASAVIILLVCVIYNLVKELIIITAAQ